jgi:hypothetical protein
LHDHVKAAMLGGRIEYLSPEELNSHVTIKYLVVPAIQHGCNHTVMQNL